MARRKFSRKNISRRSLFGKNDYSKRKNKLSKNTSSSGDIHRFLSCLFLIVLLAFCYFIFYSEFFRIKQLILIDNHQVNEAEIKEVFDEVYSQSRYLILPGDNIIVFDSK